MMLAQVEVHFKRGFVWFEPTPFTLVRVCHPGFIY